MEQKTSRFGRAATVLALIATGAVTRGAERPQLTLVAYVSDQAATGRSLLSEAQAQADRIFKDAGVRLVWLEVTEESYKPGCDGFSVLVTLLSPAMVQASSGQGRSQKALGSAARAAGRAFVHPLRIHELASGTRSDAGELMGRVLAHEIGHLLLPEGHSHYGIMAAGMETDPTVSARFTVPQTRDLRAFLASKAVAAVGDANCGSRRAAAGRN